MTETKPRQRSSIPETLMLARLAQAEQMREFFIEMWLQNPAMARQAGARVQAILSPPGAVPPSRTLSAGDCALCPEGTASPCGTRAGKRRLSPRTPE